MQNYHTSNSGPLTAILAVIRDADPQRGVTARQIAEATGLSIVHTIVPALHGYKRGGIIRYVASPDVEIHVAMADGTRSLVDTSDTGELEAHMVDEGLIAERPLPLTYVRGYCLQCRGYDEHIQGCYCRACWNRHLHATGLAG